MKTVIRNNLAVHINHQNLPFIFLGVRYEDEGRPVLLPDLENDPNTVLIPGHRIRL